MPTWSKLQQRNRNRNVHGASGGADEILVLDARGRMKPRHFVEEKLQIALANEKRSLRRVPR
jgi:hypothetical protein